MSRPGIKLQHRDGYYAMNPGPRFGENITAHQFSDALSINAPAATAVAFQAAVAPPSGNSVTVNFAIDPHTLAFQRGADELQHAALSCVIWAYSGKGNPVRSEGGSSAALKPEEYQQLMGSYFPCKRTLELKPGHYTLRLGVVDRTTNLIGTASAELTMP